MSLFASFDYITGITNQSNPYTIKHFHIIVFQFQLHDNFKVFEFQLNDNLFSDLCCIDVFEAPWELGH